MNYINIVICISCLLIIIYYNRAIRRPRESFRAKVEKINGDCVRLNEWAHDTDILDILLQTQLTRDIPNI